MLFNLKNKVSVTFIFVLVLLVSGISIGLVEASIPDNGGIIHGCYSDKNGSLRVIDTGIGDSCNTSKETALNWNQTGPGVRLDLYDNNGQSLGGLIDYNPNTYPMIVEVYNNSLNRTVSLSPYNGQMQIGTYISAIFESSDCAGSPFLAYNQNGFSMPAMKTALLYWVAGGKTFYGIVDDTSTPQTINAVSSSVSGGNTDCSNSPTSNNPISAIPITEISSPYDNISMPFRLGASN